MVIRDFPLSGVLFLMGEPHTQELRGMWTGVGG